MSGLFPLIGAPDGGDAVAGAGLPLAKEIDWDFKSNQPVWRGGRPVCVTGARAVLVWAWNALHTQRLAHDVYTANYGQDIHKLIGRAYTEGIRQSEAVRIIQETLLVNPYISAVEQVRVGFSGSTLRVSLRLKTIYGEVPIDGLDIALP